MKDYLTDGQMEELKRVAFKPRSAIGLKLLSFSVQEIPIETRLEVLDLLGDELADTGIGPTGEINDRGRSLDELITIFSRFHD